MEYILNQGKRISSKTIAHDDTVYALPKYVTYDSFSSLQYEAEPNKEYKEFDLETEEFNEYDIFQEFFIDQ